MSGARLPSRAVSRGARLRAGLRVLAWTAPVALVFALPNALTSDTNTRQATHFRTPAPSLEALSATRAADTAVMVARPIAFLSHQRELSYPFKQVWPTAIRYLKVDRKYKLTDKDQDAGYIMFEFPHGPNGTGAGSLELLPSKDASGRDAVKVMISTSNGPAHLPHTLGEGLTAKIKNERGQPAPPPPSSPPQGDKPNEGDKEQPKEDDDSWILYPNGDR